MKKEIADYLNAETEKLKAKQRVERDEYKGHKFRMNGDVSQCRCGEYLGLWDWEKVCPKA